MIKRMSHYEQGFDVDNFNQMVDTVNALSNFSFSSDFNYSRFPFRVSLIDSKKTREGSSLDLSSFLCAPASIERNRVNMNDGLIIRASTREHVEKTPIFITETNQWIYLAIEKKVGGLNRYRAATIVPANNWEYVYVPLQMFRLIDGVATVSKIAHIGAVQMIGVWE